MLYAPPPDQPDHPTCHAHMYHIHGHCHKHHTSHTVTVTSITHYHKDIPNLLIDVLVRSVLSASGRSGSVLSGSVMSGRSVMSGSVMSGSVMSGRSEGQETTEREMEFLHTVSTQPLQYAHNQCVAC